MPYTVKQRRLFHGVAAGTIPASRSLSRATARKLAAEADRLPTKPAVKAAARRKKGKS